MKFLIYPVFGLILLGGYAFTLSRGFDPGAVSSDARALPPGANAQGRHPGSAAGPGFWFVGGGFGGGK